MNRITFILVFLFTSVILNAQKSVDLFIWAGQSNAQGWTGDAQYYPEEEKELDKEILLNWTFFGNESSNGEWVAMQAQKGRYLAGHFGPEVSFARELKKAGYNPAIFKYCLGATGLARDWKAPGKDGIYDRMVADLGEAIKKLEENGYLVSVKGFVWIQGESDGDNDEHANVYFENLDRLIYNLRNKVLQKPELKVILGVDEQHKFMEDRPTVVESQKRLAGADRNIIFTSMYGLPKADATHLTPKGLVQHGKRIYKAYWELEKADCETLKVITYNIWNGFDWGKDKARRTKLQQWMKAQKADIVALQELCKYSPQKLEEDAKSWGHNYSVLLKESGYSVGLTSKYPIELKEKIRDEMHHGALHCKTNGIDFLVVHLHPGSIKRRREETKILLNKLDEIKAENSKYMVLGDFNAQSPFDAHLYEQDGYFLSRLRKNDKGKGIDGNLYLNDLDYSVIADFLSFPLYDVTRKFTKGMGERGSFPGRVLGPLNNETDQQLVSRLERIDYILVSPELEQKCIKARVANGEQNWYLSDHYPVIAVFE